MNLFKWIRKKRFEKALGIPDADKMICAKCKILIKGSGRSYSIGPNNEIRCSNCWDWL
jgi:hypothetical protein